MINANIKSILMILCVSCTALVQAQQSQPLHLSNSQCREMAKESNRNLKVASNNIEKAKIEKQLALSNFMPNISGTANMMFPFSDYRLTDSMEMSLKGAYMAGITVSQPIYTGGKLKAGYKSAKLGVEMSKVNEKKEVADIVADVDQAYWLYVSVCQKVKLLESYKIHLQELKKQISLSVSVQMGTRNDLLTIETKNSQIDYQLQKATNGRELSRIGLCQKIGVDTETPIVAQDTAIQVNPISLDQLMGDISARPELQLLEYQLKLKEEGIKLARADYLPTIALSGGYSLLGGYKIGDTRQGANGSGSLMATASIPIYHVGENFKKIRKAKIEVENSQLELEHNRELLSLEVQQQRRNVTDAYKMIQTAELSIEQAEESLRLTKLNYQEKMNTLSDVLDAQSRWQESYSNLIEAKANYKIQYTAYLKAVGKLQ